jgi:protein-tyrosine phosphatase
MNVSKLSSGSGVTCIIDGLYVSSLEESFDRPFLETHDITHVLNVAEECNLLGRLNREYKHVKIADDDPETNITIYIPECIKFIDEGIQSGNVLVHCLEGISRSVCIVLSYLVIKCNYTFDAAFDLIKQKRPQVDPFLLYLEQLRRFFS